ncbi:hypothetical protein [Cohnella sp. AR92]|uniref:hypothetical protein n=1 Tax=Cohnella sp. AR92 TaxID=648716 RepID=UPI000F8DE748|nr:hypothetical protein [Cohnella sp. AR92]RUS43880.1 hypothetical protein ELR57_23710 [Cohnella sp. AR92]
MSRKIKAMAAVLHASLLAALLSACSHSSGDNAKVPVASPANSPKTELAMGTDAPPSASRQPDGIASEEILSPPLLSPSPVEEDKDKNVAPTQPAIDAPKKNRPSEGDSEALSSSASAASQPSSDGEQAPKPIPESELDTENPQLAGIRLGASEADVKKRLGAVRAEYDLPDGGTVIHMKDYAGVTVGFSGNGYAVYIELTDSAASSGLKGIGLGASGQEAADALGLPLDPDALLLLLEVSGGQYKIDLDPDTRETLSVKLIGLP